MRWVPGAMIVCSVVFELLTPAQYAATPLFAVACVTAGAILRLSGTAWTVAVAVCATVVLAVFQDRWGHIAGTAELADVAAAGLAAFWVNWLVARQRSRLAVARGVAEEMQRVLLPPPPGVLGGLEIAARYEAAQAEARVGGDFYAVQETPFGLRMILGDVRGKGLGAVATVSTLTGAFREGAGRASDLPALAERLEDALDREKQRNAEVESRFATAILAEVPRGAGSRLVLLNRGHPAVYLVADGRVRALLPPESALPLGMRDLADSDVVPMAVEFPVDALLVMVTDGVTEARDSRGEFYDPQLTLAGLASPCGAQEAVDALSADAVRWEHGPAADDRAILAVRRAAVTPRDEV
ncbi:MAG: serine/threonine-protein phosphatase [Streptomyces sp.]|nr:serine/threonine-protein phosphatase [Streptomyces sp.]